MFKKTVCIALAACVTSSWAAPRTVLVEHMGAVSDPSSYSADASLDFAALVAKYSFADLAPIQYLIEGEYTIGYGRLNGFYGEDAFPRHFTDGIVISGAGNYDRYERLFLVRHDMEAPLTITFVTTELGETEVRGSIRVTLTADNAFPSSYEPVVYIMLWEDKVDGGGRYTEPCRYVQRGICLDKLHVTAAGQTQDIDYTFGLFLCAGRENLGVTAWVQDPGGEHEVYNAAAVKLSDGGQ